MADRITQPMTEPGHRRDPGLYDFVPYDESRPKVRWPNGARVALWVAPNFEFYEYDPPGNPSRAPWKRPHPDVLHHAERDYGNRVAHWRMMEVLDRHEVKGSVSLNVAMCQHHPEIVKEAVDRGWELFSHGVYNTRYTYHLSEAQERALIEDCIETVERFSGERIAGWLAPALTHTERTMDLLAEYGILYTCDLFHDDQPQPVRVKQGRLISIPYSLEMNDVIVYNVENTAPRRYAELLKANFDQLYAEGAENGTVMCIPLHAYLVGQPHRIGALDEALEHILAHEDVWVATGREIAEHYFAHCYDDAVAHIERLRADDRGGDR